MTIFGRGEKQYQFDNFEVKNGTLQFPALGAQGASIKIVPGYSVITDETSDVAAAAKAVLANVVGGQLTKEKTTQLSLNGKTVVVLTDSLVKFAKATASNSKTMNDLTDIIEQLADEPQALGSFVLSLVANAELTRKLEIAGEAGTLVSNLDDGGKDAISSAVDKKSKETKEETQIRLLIEGLNTPEAKKILEAASQPSTFELALQRIAAEKAYVDARQIVVYEAPVAEPKATYLRTLKNVASKALNATTSAVKKVAGKGVAGGAAVAALTVSAAKKAGALATTTTGLVLLTNAAFIAAIVAKNHFGAEEVVVVPEPVTVVEETSNAVYAAAILGSLAIGAGVEKLALKAKQFAGDVAQAIA